MKKEKNIIIYIESHENFHFFKRFIPGLNQKNIKIIFITNKISLFYICKKNKIKVQIVKKNTSIPVNIDLTRVRDVVGNELSIDEAKVLYSSIVFHIGNSILLDNIIAFFLWNGYTIPTLALKEIAEKNEIKTVYFEIANIPGRMFIDPDGHNIRSSIYSDPAVLNNYKCNDAEYYKWLKVYLEQKKENIPLPQSTLINKIHNILFPLDLLGFYFLNIPKNGNTNIFSKISNIMRGNKLNYDFDKYNLNSNKYIFLPLQVTRDSQILADNYVSNEEAIFIAQKMARKQEVDLVVKPHPAESDNGIDNRINKLKKELNFILVNNSTFEIIKNAYEIITINSTVGLEAKIMGKKVTFIGPSIYSIITNENIKNYILKYLIELEYFSDKKINNKIIEIIFNRCEINS